MCGLAGAMSSSLSFPEVDMFKDLFNIASLRGSTGAGVVVNQTTYKNEHDIKVLKTKHISGALAYSEEFSDLMKSRVNCLIGHARFPTKGGLDEGSIHPHQYGHIVGVHNGTMHRIAGEEVKEQSDSAMLFKAISEVGIDEAIKGSSGAYALVWIDQNEGTINFLRNAYRTLFFKNVGWGEKNINTLYWSSEQEMLDLVFERSYRGNNTWDTYLPTDTLYKYPLDVSHIIRPIEVKKDVRPTPPVTQQTQSGNGHGDVAGGTRRFIRGLRWDHDLEEYVEEKIELRGNVRNFRQDELPWAGMNRVLRLPPPDVQNMSKQGRKKYLRELAKEERQAQQRLATFRREREIEELRKQREKETDIRPALAELVEDIPPDLDRRHTVHNGAHRTASLSDRRCCWCDTPAETGDKVYLANNDLGCREFICWDCGTSSSVAAVFVADARIATVVP